MRVLIPVGHAVATSEIVDRCRRFADVGQCTVFLAHVAPHDAAGGYMEGYLGHAARTLRQAGLDVRVVIRGGEPSTEVAHLARELDACLLVPA